MPRFESGKPNQVEEALPHKSPSRLTSFARREEMRSEEELKHASTRQYNKTICEQDVTTKEYTQSQSSALG
ncbi:hypothetical protein PV326_014118 [Microctonus aethiopoides]|nr:hypothetical protein PV326_014118 [Microctonus aethiopoides]